MAENPLTAADWDSLVVHLLTGWSFLKQGILLPRLPFSQMAAALVEGMETEELKQAVLLTLRNVSDLREQTWGAQELQEPRKRGSWLDATLGELPEEIHNGFVRALGEEQVGEHQDTRVDDLPAELHEAASFVLAMRGFGGKAIGTLPYAGELAAQMGEELKAHLLDTPLAELDPEIVPRVREHLRAKGLLEDPTARSAFLARPIGAWDRRMQEQVARTVGAREIEASRNIAVAQLEPRARDIILRYLRGQRRFIDEDRVQRFLVHEGLGDLPAETRQAALSHLALTRTERLSRRKVSNLDVATRQQVLDVAQRLGLLSAPERRDSIAARALSEIGTDFPVGFGLYLARQTLAGAKAIGALPEALRGSTLQRLRELGVLDSAERVQAFAGLHLADLGEPAATELRQALASRLESDLASKTMEELPGETRALVHRALAGTGYFVDAERVGWYERRTLAQLPSDILQGLEQHLGKIHLSAVAYVPFRDLAPGLQEPLLASMDAEGILPERAERLRLTQVGQLADLNKRDFQALARQLGRRWLVRIRDQRPAALPDADREAVWAYVRDQGLVSDKDKEELFPYMRLDEFGPEARIAVEAALVQGQESMLGGQAIGLLPEGTQADIRDYLTRAGYFVDAARVQEIESLPISELPAGLRSSVQRAFADCIVADASLLEGVLSVDTPISPDSLRDVAIGQLPGPLQAALWRYLDEIGYFLDEARRAEILDRRLGELGDDVLEEVRSDFVKQIASEIGGKPIADLSEELRQALREAVEAQGFFESRTAQTRALEQPLGTLSRTDLDALALELGLDRLTSWAALSVLELPAPDQEPLLAYAQKQDWFLDPVKLEQLPTVRTAGLGRPTGPGRGSPPRADRAAPTVEPRRSAVRPKATCL